jgi:hypothetical protein
MSTRIDGRVLPLAVGIVGRRTQDVCAVRDCAGVVRIEILDAHYHGMGAAVVDRISG